jgi:hypothetical protein
MKDENFLGKKKFEYYTDEVTSKTLASVRL